MTVGEQKSGGGSLLIAWQLKGKHVLIVGGGEVAAQRIDSILVTDATIIVLSPVAGLGSRTRDLISSHVNDGRVVHLDRKFSGSDELDGMDMVLTALDDNKLSEEIVHMCRERRIPVNAADIPPLCDFYFGAQIRDGPLQILISTNGNGPRMAALIRTRLQNGLTGLEGRAIEKVGLLRERLKERVPGVGGKDGRQRMMWMKELCDVWDMEDLAILDESTMDLLLAEGWENDRRILSPREIMPKRNVNLPSPKDLVAGAILSNTVSFALGVLCTGLFFVWRQRR